MPLVIVAETLTTASPVIGLCGNVTVVWPDVNDLSRP